MRMCGRSPCTSVTAASESRLTSTRRFLPESAHYEVYESPRHEDLFHYLLALEVATHALEIARKREHLGLIRVGQDHELVAALAVDLDDEGHLVGHEPLLVGLWPWRLPHTVARELVVDLSADMRREGKDQRRGGRR